MARVRIRDEVTPSAPTSNDPRQTDLETYIAKQVAVAKPGGSHGFTPFKPEWSLIDGLAAALKERTGCGCTLIFCGDPTTAHTLVMLTWTSKHRTSNASHTGFFPDSPSALKHAVDYEVMYAEKGADAAEAFHLRARCASEAHAIHAIQEKLSRGSK